MAVRRKQDFAASKLGGEISHFKRDMRNLPDQIRDCLVRFETHPLHAEFAFSRRQPEFRCDGTGALFFALRGIGTNPTLSLPRLKPRPRGRTFEARSQLCLTGFGASQIRNVLPSGQCAQRPMFTELNISPVKRACGHS